MFRAETIKEIRRGSTSLVLVFLVTLYDKDGNLLYRLNSSDEEIESNGLKYSPFHFRVDLPTQSESNPANIGIIFANFPTKEVLITEVLKTVRAQIAVFDKNFPDDAIVPKREIFLTGYSRRLSEITLAFTSSFIRDRKFPFRNYNSIDHPRLYER